MSGADLLEEHLVEIRSLRQRLEESICTNDRLREQLERRLASTGKASGTGLHRGQLRGGRLCTPRCTGKGTQPLHGAVLGRGAQHPSPFAGLPGDVYAQGPELGLQLSGENRALREDNQTLRLQCDHLSRGRARPDPSGSESQWAHPAC